MLGQGSPLLQYNMVYFYWSTTQSPRTDITNCCISNLPNPSLSCTTNIDSINPFPLTKSHSHFRSLPTVNSTPKHSITMAFKLYYTSTSCGAASYIAASLAGLEFDSEQVSIPTHKTASGADFYAINKKGNVPTLVFDDGTVISENVASLAYIASQTTKDNYLPAPPCIKSETVAYFDFLDKLGYVNSEMHKAYAPLFMDRDLDATKKAKAVARVVEKGKFFTDNYLGENKFVGGDKPSVIDIYAYIVFTWSSYIGVDLAERNPTAAEFVERMKAVPQIAKAHEEMNAAPKA